MKSLSYLWLAGRLKTGLQTSCNTTFFGVRFRVEREHYQLRAALKAQAIQPVLAKLLSLCDEDTLFLDIGANIGLFSLLIAAKTGAYVLAFEPVRSTFQAMAWNFSLNPNLSITPFNFALGSAPDIVEITATPHSGINQIAAVSERTHEPLQSVLQLTLDQLSIARLLDARKKLVLKIDVERYEFHVLAGARDLLRINKPILICIEVPLKEKTRVEEVLGEQFHLIQPVADQEIPIETGTASEDLFYVNDAWLQTF